MKEKKCPVISEDATSLKKVGERIRADLDCEVRELLWKETPLGKSESGKGPLRGI
jgi:hypothetical protein